MPRDLSTSYLENMAASEQHLSDSEATQNVQMFVEKIHRQGRDVSSARIIQAVLEINHI